MPLRIFCSTVLIALAVCSATASAAPQHAAGISPSLIHRGQRTTISVPTQAATPSCTALLRYADGKVQTTPRTTGKRHHVTFVVRIPLDAPLGAGHWTVLCGQAVVGGSFVVVAAKSTVSDATPRVVVDNQGFSQRSDAYGTGSLLSFGLILRNTSSTEDAEKVYVIVNMVAADGELLASKAQTIALVPAGGTYSLGDSMTLRTQVATTKLEVTVRVGAHEPKKPVTLPDFANVRILPHEFDPGWVGEVDGEVVNDTSKLTLQSASISVVILDASGTPLGGGTGYLSAPVPSGARFVFLAQNGFTAIPLDRAATALVSVEPLYSAS